MNPPKIITKEQFVEICYNFVKEEMQYDEPIPDITEGGLNKIEYCLNKPLVGLAQGGLFYKTIAEQTAALCFCICKNHCFINGNKRLAIITSLLFLLMNGYILKRDKSIKRLLYLVAAGTVITKQSKDEIVRGGLKEFFDYFIESYNVGLLITQDLFKK